MLRTSGSIALALLPLFAAWAGCAQTPPPTALMVNATPTIASAPTVSAPPHYLGRVSCAAAGCHGHHSSTPVSWNNAYTLWDATDPHRWAFDVLYTDRSYKIYDQLEQPDSRTIDKSRYLKFLVKKCVGCHATPPEKMGITAASTPASFVVTDPGVFSQGVSCESCHGPASDWEGRHFLKSWKAADADPAQRAQLSTTHHFQDLRPLANRAEVCVKCHVGPQVIGDQSERVVYDVNHDLIAAGHPRLNFEFNAYLTNLPKHWDEAEVWKKQTQTVPAAFHFAAWQTGQIQKLKQLGDLERERPRGEWAEFANQDCRKCHHAIGEPSFVWNRRERWTVEQLTAPAPATDAQRASLLLRLINGSRKPNMLQPAPGFDEAVDLYLAAKAFSQDREDSAPALKVAVNALGAEIEKQHTEQQGKSPYDLIDGFDPQTQEFRDAIRSLESELAELSKK